MKSSDPASLLNLNDIILPEAVSWWPLASGWYFVLGFLLIIMAVLVYKWIQRWINNGYRRSALQQLQLLAEGSQDPVKRDSCLRQLPVLLKRTALSVYPRIQLASLSGKKWHDYLNSKVSTASFDATACALLDRVSYSVGDLSSVDKQASTALLDACKHWLIHHQTGTGA